MRIKTLAIPLACLMLLAGCANTAGDASGESSAVVFAMDTEMQLKAYGKHADEAINAAKAEINRLDRLFRRGDSDSEIYRINKKGSYKVFEDTAKLTRRACEIGDMTGGVFDITIAPVMDMWGFYTKEFRVPDKGEIESVLGRVDHRNVTVSDDTVTVSNGSELDLGGIAKGYLSSRIMEIYTEHGITSGIVSLGGNVQALGTKPEGSNWNIAIMDPTDSAAYIGSVRIKDKAVITSGGYQRFFERGGKRYHHIIDPSTGYPADSGLSSVTIISEDGTLADGLSTSLYIMGLDKSTKFWYDNGGFDAIFVTDDGKIYITEGLDGIFESRKNYEVIKQYAVQSKKS